MQANIKTIVVQIIVVFGIFAIALFVPAGTIDWVAAWIFLLLFFGFSIILFSWLYRHNPGLLRERMRLGTSDQKVWDKALFPLLQVVLLAWLIFMGLDAVRFHCRFGHIVEINQLKSPRPPSEIAELSLLTQLSF